MTREVTNLLLESADDGCISWRDLAEACMQYMSEDEVADMARINEFPMELEEDDDE